MNLTLDNAIRNSEDPELQRQLREQKPETMDAPLDPYMHNGVKVWPKRVHFFIRETDGSATFLH